MKLTTKIKLNKQLNKVVRAEVAHPRKIEKSMFPTFYLSKYSQTDSTSYVNEPYYVELDCSYNEKDGENTFFIRRMYHINKDIVEREDLGFITKYAEVVDINKFDIVDIDGKDRFIFYKIMIKEINYDKSKPIAVGYFKDDRQIEVGERLNFTMCLSCKRKYDEKGNVDEKDVFNGRQNGYSCLEAIKIRKC